MTDNIRYKLTTQQHTTFRDYHFPVDGSWVYAKDMDSAPEPCTGTVLHHYANPLLAILFNNIHSDIKNPLLFEIEIDHEIDTDGAKGWCRSQRVLRQLEPPVLTVEERIAIAIYSVEAAGYDNSDWIYWATEWLSSVDRSAASALAIYYKSRDESVLKAIAHAAMVASKTSYAAYIFSEGGSINNNSTASDAIITSAHATAEIANFYRNVDILAIADRVLKKN